MQFLDNYRYLKGANEVNRVFSASCAIMLAKSTVLLGGKLVSVYETVHMLSLTHLGSIVMLEYAPMLHVSYYAQNYAGIICQGLQ